jgi:hypothetical protein
MWPLDERLEPGKEYAVAEIHKGTYAVVEGRRSPSGGLSGTEFEPKHAGPSQRD